MSPFLLRDFRGSIEHVSFVKLDPVRAKQSHPFGLEVFFLVMLGLSGDIAFDGVLLRWAYREDAESFLRHAKPPGELLHYSGQGCLGRCHCAMRREDSPPALLNSPPAYSERPALSSNTAMALTELFIPLPRGDQAFPSHLAM